MIEVKLIDDDDPMRFDVAVTDGGSTTRHKVTLSAGDCERMGRGRAPHAVIEGAFRFLLDREAKESILSRFDVNVIGTYFPEFERELPQYLS